jgi:hypothetical protein
MKKNQGKRVAVLAIAALTLGLSAATAHDRHNRDEVFRATLLGVNETPSAISTPAEGKIRIAINEDETAITYTLSYEGLSGGKTLFAHIHFGERHTTGGVMVFLCGGGDQPDPCPDGQGVVNGTITADSVIGPTGQGIDKGQFEKVLAAIRGGTSYANVHTTKFGSGEIRGQLNPR